MWARYGQVLAVFVWADDATEPTALRLRADATTHLEQVSVPVEFLTRFRRGRGPSLRDIEQWFSGDTRRPPIETWERHRDVPYRYGEKPTWQLVLDAVRALPRPVSATHVGDLITAQVPDFARSNLAPDLSLLSVNCPSRGHHSVNRKPRRTDRGNVYDALVRLENPQSREVFFQLYQPEIHGVWELLDLGGKALMPRFVARPDDSELEDARASMQAEGLFETGIDGRRHVIATIVQRDGQPAFRDALLEAYGAQCAISGCRVRSLLEAAHIVPYRGTYTNAVPNGLLLRAGLHKLFDLHLLHIDPYDWKVCISSELRGTEYECLDGAMIRLPQTSKALLHLWRCNTTQNVVVGCTQMWKRWKASAHATPLHSSQDGYRHTYFQLQWS